MFRQIKQALKRRIPTSLYERYWYYRRYPHKLVYPLYLGWRYECPMCKGKFRQLVPRGLKLPVIVEKQIIGTGFRINADCPKCNSFDRERLIYLYLCRRTDFLRRPVRLFHVSPEEQLEIFLRSQPNITYFSADLGPSRVDLRLDVTRMPLLDASIDLIICSHVLEHVPDDRRAISEMFRVLKPGGSAILQVPISLLLRERTKIRMGRVPNDVGKASRGSEHGGLGSWAMRDLRGYPDMGRPGERDPEPIVRWCHRGHRRQAASSAAVGTGIANARARSDQPSSFRKQICPEATRP
jgi:SAM-dependent methyltransferase